MLISNETNKMLNLLIQQGFILNRIWDRGLSVLNVKFAMNNFEKIFHVGLAHKFPVDWSDTISEIQSKYNIVTEYLETYKDISDYNEPIDFFEKNLQAHQETYNIICDAIKIANVNGDFNVEAELKNFMIIFNQYMNQAILLKDKSQSFKDDYAMFDSMADKFYLFGN